MPPKRAPFLPLKPCLFCGELLQYQRYKTVGQWKTETNKDYELRKFCSLSCSAAYNNNRLGARNKHSIWDSLY